MSIAVAEAIAPTSRVVLDNGLTVLAVQNMSTQVAAMALVVKVSAEDDPEGKTGTRALLQQLILTCLLYTSPSPRD